MTVKYLIIVLAVIALAIQFNQGFPNQYTAWFCAFVAVSQTIIIVRMKMQDRKK